MARKLNISSQLYGYYEEGSKKPGGKLFINWKKAFGTDLATIFETTVSHENEEPLMNEDSPKYGIDYKDKYISLLEKENEKKDLIISVSLNELILGNRISQAHLKALLQITVVETAVMQNKDPEAALMKANKVVADNFLETGKEGN